MEAIDIEKMGDYKPFLFIFDDEELFIRPFARRLRKEGFRVHTAKDKKRAMHLIGSTNYDGYCVDIHTDWEYTFGLSLIQNIRRRNPKSYIDAVSAHKNYQKTAKQKGADHFTEKPIINFDGYAKSLMKRIKKGILETLKTYFPYEDDTFDKYLSEIVNTLRENPEIRTILIEIFGKEIPEIKQRVDQLDRLYSLSRSYLKGSDLIMDVGKKILSGA